MFIPGWCGSVDWALACEPKGHWFYPLSRQMLRLHAGPLLGVCKRQPTDVSLAYWSLSSSLSPSLPLSLKKKLNLKKIMFTLYVSRYTNQWDDPSFLHPPLLGRHSSLSPGKHIEFSAFSLLPLTIKIPLQLRAHSERTLRTVLLHPRCPKSGSQSWNTVHWQMSVTLWKDNGHPYGSRFLESLFFAKGTV